VIPYSVGLLTIGVLVAIMGVCWIFLGVSFIKAKTMGRRWGACALLIGAACFVLAVAAFVKVALA